MTDGKTSNIYKAVSVIGGWKIRLRTAISQE